MNDLLRSKAGLYANSRDLELAETLGSGKDGIVLTANQKKKHADVAIKIFRWEEAFRREKAVYERLAENGVAAVLGFNVPQMTGFDDQILAVEMTIVKRPFVLDFAGAYLDAAPEFPEDVVIAWEEEMKERFEGRWRMVEQIMAEFRTFGIHLLDLSLNNIGFLD